MKLPETCSFGQIIRDRRRQLDLTQEEVASRINASTPYIAHLDLTHTLAAIPAVETDDGAHASQNFAGLMH